MNYTDKLQELFKQLGAHKQELLELTKKYIELNNNYNKLVVSVQESQRRPFEPGYTIHDGCGTTTMPTKEYEQLKRDSVSLSKDLAYYQKQCSTLTRENASYVGMKMVDDANRSLAEKNAELERSNERLLRDNNQAYKAIEERTAMIASLNLEVMKNQWYSAANPWPPKDRRVLVACVFTCNYSGDMVTKHRNIKSAVFDGHRYVIDGQSDYKPFWKVEVLAWREMPALPDVVKAK